MLRINAAFFKCFQFPLTLFRSAQAIAESLRKESAGISIPRLSAWCTSFCHFDLAET
jgi:hypothetical protein